MAINGALPFRPAYVEGGGTPVTRHYVNKTSETFYEGSIATINAGEVDVIDTNDVTLIVGVAGAASESAFGYDLADSPTVVTGRSNTIPVYVANTNTVFYGQLSNADTALVAPDAANVGEDYGILIQADGVITVDESDTTNVVVNVIKFDTSVDSPGRVYFKFLQSAIFA